jgi:hypothetical protein
MSQGCCGELLEIKIAGGLESWNPTSRNGREKWGHPAMGRVTV